MSGSNTNRSVAADTRNPYAVSSPSVFAETCKRLLASGLYRTGLFRMARRFESTHELRKREDSRLPRLCQFSGSKFGILCYHRIGTEGVPLFSRLEPRVFETQIRYIRRHYRIVSLAQLCHELKNEHSVPPTLSITFDDGYRDLYTHAFPVLQKYQVHATIYLIGECMETGEAPWYDRIFAALQALPEASLELELNGPRRFQLSSREARMGAAWEIVCYLRTIPDTRRREWCKAFESGMQLPQSQLRGRMLDWRQVRAMHRAGVFFGAHTATHPAVSRLDPENLGEELGRSRQILENALQSEVRDFAYPFGKPGDCSIAAENFFVANGYRSAATTVEGCNTTRTNLYRLCRLQVDDDPSISYFAFRLSRMFLDCTPETIAAESHVPARGQSATVRNQQQQITAKNA
jgi:peptidoglycan/xylan/chitin deacetylase (PgdA/CDA1 family)